MHCEDSSLNCKGKTTGKKFVVSTLTFIAICIMGAIIMNAAGVIWGTTTAGLLMFYTFLFASFLFTCILTFPSEKP